MSEEKISLALTFLQSYPELAASILEKHEISDVAAFMAEIPPSYATPVLQYMLPQHTARLCNLLERATALVILSRLEVGQVAAIFRYYEKQHRNELLEELPTKTKLGCALLLKYSRDLVGAWITPHIATIPYDYLVEEALNYIQSTPDLIHTDNVFTVNRDRRLEGRIRLTDLLRASPKQSVISLARQKCHTLTARMQIRHAADDKEWKIQDVIPVLNRNQKFIGVLRHVDLRNSLDALETKIARQEDQNSLSNMVQVYGDSLLALFDSLKEMVASDTRS